jgi:hypothetical protein
MGHGVSCARTGDEHDYFRAAQVGDLEALEALLDADPSLARRATLYNRLSALHIAAANGRLEVPPPPPPLFSCAPHPRDLSQPTTSLTSLRLLPAGAVNGLGSRGAAGRGESAQAGAGSRPIDAFFSFFLPFFPPFAARKDLSWATSFKNLTYFFSYPLQSNQQGKKSHLSTGLLCLFFSVQTPLMLAAMHGKTDCVLKLLQAGANVSGNLLLLFFFRASTSDQLQTTNRFAVRSVPARSSCSTPSTGGPACTTRPTSATSAACRPSSRRRGPRRWPTHGERDTFTSLSGPTYLACPAVRPLAPPATTHSLLCKPGRGFARFVNVRDDHGATPLHLAARQGRPGCVQALLENGAIVSALTGSYGYGSKVSCSSWLQLLTCTVRRCRFPGSTSLHLAARSGSLDCTRKLLAWGADRLRRDSAG